MILLLDVGNTRLKSAWLDGERLSAQQACAHRDLGVNELSSLLFDGTRPSRVLVSNVAGQQLAQLLAQASMQAAGIDPEFVVSTRLAAGVTNAYAIPEQLGVDRWLALIATHASGASNACVVSVGTAMTVDGLAADGRHLGGVIVPGPQLMEASLLRETSDLAARSAQGQLDATSIFATNTRAAIHRGAQEALGALIDRAVDAVGETTAGPIDLVVTGGAADLVLASSRHPGRIIPDLVLRGLAVIAHS